MNPRRSLTSKLVLAFWLVSMLGIALVAVLAGVFAERQLGNLARSQTAELLAAELTGYYAEQGSWQGLSWPDSLRGPRRMHGRVGEPPFVLYDQNGRAILRSNPGLMTGMLSGPTTSIDLTLDGDPIGRLEVASPGFGAGTLQASLANRLRQNLILAALAATAGSLLIGVVVARRLTTPIQEVKRASQAVAQGDLQAWVPVRSQDELGELAAAFNQMQAQLGRLQEQRRNMTADLAHELRTPLGILLGNAEALRDGVLPPTPERLDAIHEQSRRLSRLVEDLRTLSLGEAGELPMHPQQVDLRGLISGAVDRHQPQAMSEQVEIGKSIPASEIVASIDPDRINQVLDILLSNAIRHAGRPGTVAVSLERDDDSIQIRVRDDGAGIPEDEIEQLFQRYYRAQGSQPGDSPGSGLGLAIAQSLVKAHAGSIAVESHPGAGTTFVVELPRHAPEDKG